jgi:hypothetical protein
MFNIYGYDPDTGELMFVEGSIDDTEWKSFANELHFEEGYLIKVFDQSADRNIVYTLGYKETK